MSVRADSDEGRRSDYIQITKGDVVLDGEAAFVLDDVVQAIVRGVSKLDVGVSDDRTV